MDERREPVLIDSEIIIQLAQHVNPEELRHTIIYNQDLTLKNILEKAHIFDQSTRTDEHVAAIHYNSKPPSSYSFTLIQKLLPIMWQNTITIQLLA